MATKTDDRLITGYIYARYSPGPQQTEASIEGQVRECKEYADRNGIRIINVYSDSKQTGRNDKRGVSTNAPRLQARRRVGRAGMEIRPLRTKSGGDSAKPRTIEIIGRKGYIGYGAYTRNAGGHYT